MFRSSTATKKPEISSTKMSRINESEDDSILKKKSPFLQTKNRIDSESKIKKFHEAIRNNNVDLVRRYLEAGINANAQDMTTGKLPLIEATNLGHVEIVKALLTAHADVNLSNIQGNTALHVSVNPKVFNKEIVQLFLERRNADYNIQDKVTESIPLHILGRVCMSVKNIPVSTLHIILKEMVSRCNLELKDKLGNTPLHIMAMGKREDVEAIEIMLAAKPNINAKNNLGETPIATAIDHGNYQLAIAMLRQEVDKSVTDRSQYTLLHYAAKKNAAHVIKKLLDKGFDPNAQDTDGDTPLHIAAGRGFVQAVSVLLKHPNILKNMQNKGGYTPLMCAVDSGFFKVVEILVMAKCDIHIKSPESRKTAVDIAREQIPKRNRRDIYDFLLNRQN